MDAIVEQLEEIATNVINAMTMIFVKSASKKEECTLQGTLSPK